MWTGINIMNWSNVQILAEKSRNPQRVNVLDGGSPWNVVNHGDSIFDAGHFQAVVLVIFLISPSGNPPEMNGEVDLSLHEVWLITGIDEQKWCNLSNLISWLHKLTQAWGGHHFVPFFFLRWPEIQARYRLFFSGRSNLCPIFTYKRHWTDTCRQSQDPIGKSRAMIG